MTLATRNGRGITGDPLESMQREFDGVLGRLLTGRTANDVSRLAPYAVDIREDADHFYLDAELPGFKKEEVEVTMENQILTISAERKSEEESKDGGNKGEWLLNERRYTRFLRSFTLPPTVSDQAVNAKLEHGVLTVTLKKREETKPRKISVQ
jgi:HSP20 family protein